MDEHLQEEPLEPTAVESKQKTISFKIPRFNSQTLVLALIALVTVFQTAQLYGLKSSAKGSVIKPAAAAAASSDHHSGSSGSGSASGGSSLPSMVGGC